MTDLVQFTKKHCLAKHVKIYDNLVTQIHKVQSEFLVYRVKELPAFFTFEKREVDATGLKAKEAQMTAPKAQASHKVDAKAQASHDPSGSTGSLDGDDDEATSYS